MINSLRLIKKVAAQHLLVCLLVLLAIFTSFGVEADECPVDAHLVSHYPLDSDLSSQLEDNVTGMPGAAINVSVGSGIVGNSIGFGESSLATAGQSDLPLSTGLSLSMWVKPSTLSSVEARFVSKALGVNGSEHYLMAGAYANDALRFRLKTGGVGGVTSTLISTSGQLRVGEWSFVTFTYDGLAMRIYNNAVLIAQRGKSGLVSQNASVPLAIGNQPPGSGSRPFIGDMDDIRIYDAALSETEIDELMAYRLGDCTSEPDTVPPGVPANFEANEVTDASVSLVWDAVVDTGGSGLAGYRLYRDGELLIETVETTFTDSTVAAASDYTYTVLAFDGAEPVNESAVVTVAVSTLPVSVDTVPPGVPANFEANEVTDASVSLVWDAVVDTGGSGLAGYRLYRDGELLIETVETTFTDSTVAAASDYTYTVLAFDGAEPVNESAVVTVAVSTLPVSVDTVPPGVPANFEANEVTDASVSLVWDAVVDTGGSGLAGYRLYRDGELLIETVETTFTDSTVAAASDYTYTVLAFDGAEPANESAVATVAVSTLPVSVDTVPPGVPANFEANEVTDASVSLVWDAVVDTGGSGLAGYRLYRDGILLAETIDTAYLDNEVVAGVTYDYSLLAYDHANPSNESVATNLEVRTLVYQDPDAGYECLILAPTLVSHYRFDETDLVALEDAVTSISGAATNVQSVTGLLSNASQWIATSEATAGQSDLPLSTGLSLSMWVKPSTLSSVEARFVSKALGVNGSEHYLMAGAYANDALRFRLKTGGVGGVTSTLISTSGQLRVGEWSFVTFTYDGLAMRIYNNAVLIAQRGKSGLVSQNASVPLAIGNQPPGSGSRPFIGDMDDIRIYDAALSETEIGTHGLSVGDCTSEPDHLAYRIK